VLPGLIAGVIGGCCLLVGIVLAYARFGAETGTGSCWARSARWSPASVFGLDFSQPPGLDAGFMLTGVSGNLRNEHPELLQQMGMAVTQLRPSGAALINGRRVDVVSEGQLIEKGTPIKVVAIEGMRVVVRAAP